MSWILLHEVLRHSDVLNHRLRVLSLSLLLNWSLNQLWAHKLVLKNLLIFSHSDKEHLDVLLEAYKKDNECHKREDHKVVNILRDAILSNRLVNCRHPIDVVLSCHVSVLWASPSQDSNFMRLIFLV